MSRIIKLMDVGTVVAATIVILAITLPAKAADTARSMKKVDGYEGYRFGMTVEQALRVKPDVKSSENCGGYSGLTACLEYASNVGTLSDTVTVQFIGTPPTLSQILLTVRSLTGERFNMESCTTVGRELLELLVSKYGDHPFLSSRKATWTSPFGGSVSFTTLCVQDMGVNVISYGPSSPL
jgi:hypothetical protein